jgi:hypothetical protein
MKSWIVLSAAALVLSSGHARAQMGVVAPPKVFELPPYRIAVTPPSSAPEGTTVRIRPVATGAAAISQQVCRLEVWPAAGGHGATWSGGSDSGCSREEAVTLPAGRYTVKLAMSWSAGGQGRSATAETPYEVTGVRKLAVARCFVDRPRLTVGRQATVSAEIRNDSGRALGPFHVVFVAGHENAGDVTVASLDARSSVVVSALFTGRAAGTLLVTCEADRTNSVGEATGFLGDNSMTTSITVFPVGPPSPNIVFGKLNLGAILWKQEYTICNADVDALYEVKTLDCAFPCSGGYSGVPATDFTPDRVSYDGSGVGAVCAGNNPRKAAFNPGPAEGPRNQYVDRNYMLTVKATKDGQSISTSVPFRVPQHCGALSIPICVETEGAKGR